MLTRWELRGPSTYHWHPAASSSAPMDPPAAQAAYCSPLSTTRSSWVLPQYLSASLLHLIPEEPWGLRGRLLYLLRLLPCPVKPQCQLWPELCCEAHRPQAGSPSSQPSPRSVQMGWISSIPTAKFLTALLVALIPIWVLPLCNGRKSKPQFVKHCLITAAIQIKPKHMLY